MTLKSFRNIYYLCPSTPHPIGGVQKIYQHVDILKRHGFSAFVLHPLRSYRYPWRKNETPTAYFSDPFRFFRIFKKIKARIKGKRLLAWKLLLNNPRIYTCTLNNKRIALPKLSAEDVIVIPDYLVFELVELFKKMPCVILNLTAYFTFEGLTIEESITQPLKLPYEKYSCIVGSNDTANYLQHTFPKIDLHICPFGVDADQFSYHPHKKKQIAFMPRRCKDHLVQIINILKLRGKIPDWSFVSLENLPQHELIEKMKSSAIYLSTSYQEGFGLPPAEALSCGGLVVGYHGEGGQEFFKPPFAHPIPHGSIIEYVKKVEEIALLFEQEHAKFIAYGKQGSDFIQNKYSIEKEDAAVIETWRKLTKWTEMDNNGQ